MTVNNKALVNGHPFLDELYSLAENNNRIDPELYHKYNVKRGLRNSDGTGVLVGLTVIGEVHGYMISEGEKVPVHGKQFYRGIDVSDLVEGCISENRFGFEEVCYLLLLGTLPSKEQLNNFNSLLGELRALPDSFTRDMILKAPSSNIMNKLARSVLVCYSYDPNPDDTSVQNVLRQSIELIARFPTLAAYGYQAKAHYHDGKSLFIHQPKPELSTAENFLSMIRPNSQYTRLEAEILDLSLMLHAEHGGGNNSAFATHVVASSGTDTYSAIAAAVGSLKGPKHGGANAKVMGMMEEIKANVSNWEDADEVAAYLTKILRKEAYDKAGLIYGMGHAVYTLSDPRSALLKRKASELAALMGPEFEKEFNLYKLIEILAPEVFARIKNDSKMISANVDFYSGFVYKMLNIPPELYTPIFAISRIVGWCAHIIEEHVSGGRIMRPAYKSVSEKRQYIPLNER